MRDQLLDAAADILAERGIMGATTREIARIAGCADGTLYNYFRSREDLFLALFERTLPMFRSALVELPLRIGQGDVSTNLEHVLLSALAFFRKVVPIFAAVFSDPDLNSGYRAKMTEGGRGPHHAYLAIEKYLQAEQRMGRIGGHVDPTTTAQQLIAVTFFQAFIERFLATATTAASDRRWAKTQVTALMASWRSETRQSKR